MLRVALFSCFLAVGACAATAAPSGPPPARMVPQGMAMQADCSGPGEASCMLDAAWQAAGLLPSDKQTRLKPAFAEITRGLQDQQLVSKWQMRLGQVPSRSPAPDFAREQAEAAIAAYGWEGFFQRARLGQAPLNMGRPEIMAAAIDLAPNAMERLRLIDMMFSFAGVPKPGTTGQFSQDDFERASFSHVLAEQMMKDCKLDEFDRARDRTAAPESIRYDLWRTRITGGAGKLAAQIRQGDGTDDTTFVRHALEGYGPILKHGYCPG